MEVVSAAVAPEDLVSATNGVSGHPLPLAIDVASRAASGGGAYAFMNIEKLRLQEARDGNPPGKDGDLT